MNINYMKGAFGQTKPSDAKTGGIVPSENEIRGLKDSAFERLRRFPIVNSYQVGGEDSHFYAGEYPGVYPGDKDNEKGMYKLLHLIHFGITHIIDLTEEGIMKPYSQWLPDGVAHIRFPVEDVSVPENTESVAGLLDTIDQILSDPRNKLYIHCYGGVGRTGTIVGCWIGRQCGNYNEALNTLTDYFKQCPKSVRRVTPESAEQRAFIKRFIDDYGKGRAVPEKEEDQTVSIGDKGIGSLLGGAIGDALGYAIEFDSWKSIKEKYGKDGIVEYELDRQGVAEISDDTQMTLFTANGLLYGETRGATRGIMGPIDTYVTTAYLEWLQTQTGERDRDEQWHSCWLRDIPEMNHRRAPGNTCMSSLLTLKNCGTVHNHSKGCGGVMRAAPVGLYYAQCKKKNEIMDFEPELFRVGSKIASCTHQHPMGYLPAAALAYIVYHLALLNAEEAKQQFESIVRETTVKMLDLFPDDKGYILILERLLNEAILYSHGEETDDITYIGYLGEGWVGDEALAIAVYCCCKYRDNLEKAIRAAVNHSGDSDSTGAVAGNMMGAMLGKKAIPNHYLDHLELRDVIEEIASDLAGGCIINGYDREPTVEKKRWEDKYIFAKHV